MTIYGRCMFWKQGSVDVCSAMSFKTISDCRDPMRLTTHNSFKSCFKLSCKNVLDTILGLRLQAIEPGNLGTISGNKFFWKSKVDLNHLATICFKCWTQIHLSIEFEFDIVLQAPIYGSSMEDLLQKFYWNSTKVWSRKLDNVQDLWCMQKVCRRSFVVFKLYGMEVLKFVEELDHEEGNLHHKCKLTIVNDLSHWFITLSKS